ncbi:MAG TPA: NAD-dependent epimerase/dehydratase family protein [Myxococcaceae bacterium]|nr:NAD-dependent epimerase/dehydratase family protein [Myxococcaceae bacterium]
MRALITGANGFLGHHLARRLTERGDTVRALVRGGSDASALSGLDVEKVEGDVTRPQSLRAAAEGVDVVFHLAGIRRAPTREAYFAVNADGTRAVCEAMVAAGARRLVLCSSLAAVGPSRPDRPHVETDPLEPLEWYGESKKEAEDIARSFAGRLEVTINRPSRIAGPGDRENLPFFRLAARGVLLTLGGPPRPLSLVDVEDAAELLLLQGESPRAVGEAFFAAGLGDTSLEGLQEEAARALGTRLRKVRIPPFVLTSLANVADAVSTLTGRYLPLNRKLARQLLAPAWTCSAEKARHLLGYTPRRTVAESISRSANWYRQQRWI